MPPVRLEDAINRLPFETWLRAEQSAERIGLPAAEADRVLRAGRRNGMLTVRREGGLLEFMRVSRRPRVGARRTRSS
ncbi:hypothetical protein [Streptomyces sp. NPDC097619]|uniref:hypothetical protein n=1 Tax=Streptomyces sp. NPDC097619 TaxID=3157228 RepID=UPI003332C9FF